MSGRIIRLRGDEEEDLQLRLNIGTILVARARINVGGPGNIDCILSDGTRPQLAKGDIVVYRARYEVWDVRHGAKRDEAFRVLYETFPVPGSWELLKVERRGE